MQEIITYVGLDVHKRSIAVCLILPGSSEFLEWEIENTPAEIRKFAASLKKKAPDVVHACYEAGPAGFFLKRKLEDLGVPCEVIAPSLVPRKPGERIKTDRRDARKLAKAFRSGDLTIVTPPTQEQESVRDLVRARDAARIERVAAQHRLTKLLDRRGIYFSGRHWTQAHQRFLDGLKFEPIDQMTFDHYQLTVSQANERLENLDRKIVEISKSEAYAAPVARLRMLRGIDTYSAMVVIVEIFEFGRFESPRALMAYLGLVPAEDSSGERVKRQSITKTGNGRVRRILIEGAQHQARPNRVSATLKKRREGQPVWALAIADRAGQRLHDRYRKFEKRGKARQKIIVAVAREMVGFIFALMNPPRTGTTA